MVRSLILAALVALLPLGGLAQDRPQNDAIKDAFAALSRGDTALAESLALPLGTAASDLIDWARLRDGNGSFEEIDAFVARRPDWPEQDRLMRAAERAITKDTDAARVRAFVGDSPRTMDGAIALADVTSPLDPNRARMLIRAWIELNADAETEARMLAQFGLLLGPHHAERVDRLLFAERVNDALRILPKLSPEERAIAQARIAYIRNLSTAGQEPEALRSVPGVAYARFDWLAAKGRYREAITLAEAQSPDRLGDPFRWSGWRRSLARWEMRQGDPDRAYRLATQNGTTPEDGYNHADLEWLAGYIALRKLDDPARALRHFEQFRTEVETPISLGRAWFWIGEARAATDDQEGAMAAWREGARYQTAFYGLLSSERAGLPLDASYADPLPAEDWRESDALRNDMVQALDLLLTAEQRGYAYRFAIALGESAPETDLQGAIAMLLEREEHFLALKVAKAAARRGLLIAPGYHPLHPLAAEPLPVDPALALSIARQESEFRADAGSPVGAQGLMQLMPGTAREVARRLGIGYSYPMLTSSWSYNARLGSAYLAGLIEDFGDSPVLVAASYNAGPGRAYEWMALRGDPREGELDPVDWIEHIPFRETRNYVQRVTESVPIYRARLSGKTGPVAFTPLLIGKEALVRPRPRPSGLGQVVVPAPAAERPALDPQSAPRPIARPSAPVAPAAPRPAGQ
ncbi:MAG: murein transglycosylase [Rhodobacterales bacterium]|nr:MAG: murein transglycosylase [Rhodobacterales bacterium]